MMLTFRGESKEMLAIRMRWNKDGAAQVRSSMKFQNGKESKMELTSSTVGFKGKTIPLIALRSLSALLQVCWLWGRKEWVYYGGFNNTGTSAITG